MKLKHLYKFHQVFELRCMLLTLTGLAVLVAAPLRAQQALNFSRFLSENTQVERGLSQNTVYSVFQDNNGFMWFGTWDGLNRFDGYTFVSYSKEQELSNESVRAICQTGNTLWVGTENGLNALNLESGKIQNFFASISDSNSINDNWINSIVVNPMGNLWIVTASGLTELNPQTLQFRRELSSSFAAKHKIKSFNALVQDKANYLWLATNNGLLHYDLETKNTIQYVSNSGDANTLPNNVVNTILLTPDKQLWVGTKRGIVQFNPKTKKFLLPEVFKLNNIQLHQKAINTLLLEPNGTLWVGTNGQGLYQYNINQQLIYKHLNRANHSGSISDNRIYSLYSDRNRMIWIGTYNGLNKLNHIAPKFFAYRYDPENKNSLSNNSVYCFEEDDENNIWIGTEDGISILNRRTNHFNFLKHNPNNENSISANQIRTIWKENKNRFWIGTRFNGLSLYDKQKNRFKHFRHKANDPLSLPDDFVLSILGDSAGNIWVGTEKGLGKLNPKTGHFKNYFSLENSERSLPDNKIYYVFIDSKKRLWVCTFNGLALYDYQSDDFTVFKISVATMPNWSASVNKFFSVKEDSKGLLWLGTRNGGLISFDPEQKIFQVFNHKNGLPNNVTYLAIEGNDGDLWISTNWGLSRFSFEKNVFTNYEAADGLQGNEFNFNAGKKLQNGELVFGGMNGFNVFMPKNIAVNLSPPDIQITAFKLFNVLQTNRIKNNDTLLLNYNDNVFSLEFAALDFINPAKIKYKYMLENYDLDWVERNSTQRFAEYAKVQPGTYRFRVRAANSDGYWDNQGVNIIIIIRAPWYNTWIFRGAALLGFVFLIYLIIALRLKSIRKTHEIEKKYLAFEKQMHELEQKALRLQMNPHFMFNALNSIQSFIVSSDIDNALHYLAKFSQLMRRTLSNSHESFVCLSDELQAVQLYIDIEKMRFLDKFDYKIEIDPNIDIGFVEIPPMIIQPYVENAIIHGLIHKETKGHLLIRLQMMDENIRVIIQDDGVGRKKAAEIRRESGIERKSLGMMITRERLELLNQHTNDTYTMKVIDVENELGEANGTRVEILIHANTS